MSLSGQAGNAQRLLMGSNDLTDYIQDVKASDDVGFADITTLGHTAKVVSVTISDGKLTINGIWEGAANAIHDILTAAKRSAGEVLTFCPMGYTVGYPAILLKSRQTNYEKGGSVNDVVKFTAAFQADGGIDDGVLLHGNTAETATVNGTAVDNAAATSNGGVIHANVTTFTGTNCTIKIQHSTNNSVWADLATLTDFTAVGSLRAIVAAGTTVNRYLRMIISGGTFSSITPIVSFARRA
jgi:hypothetical protein